jgi:Pectate lyase superfamily protein
MSAQIVGRRLLLGGAIGALATPHAQADTTFTGFRFPATGAPTPRTMPDRLAEIKSVKDFGAVGNGVTDDTAAIQAAVNQTNTPYSTANRGVISFPPGTYVLSSPITFAAESGIHNIAFVGTPGAKLLGKFSDALLKRPAYTPLAGVCSVRDLILENSHPTGRCIMFHSLVGGKVVNCQLSGWIGLETYGSQSVSVDSCSIIRSGSNNLSGSIGILAGNATSIISCDVTSFENGIRHSNAGLVVHGGRYEVNTVGIRLGVDQNNNIHQTASFSISGASMEANQTAIEIRAGAAGHIQFASGGGVSMAHGLYILGGNDIVVTGSTVSGTHGFTHAGIRVDGATRLVMLGVASPSWNIAPSVDTSGFIQTNKP